MSATSRPSDLVRDHLLANVAALSAYLPAIFWDESEQPFANKSASVIMTRQEGREVNAFVRVHDVQVWLFTPAGGDLGDADALFDDANAACEYIMTTNFVLTDSDTGKAPLIIEHVTGPYRTNENRYFYRFAMRVLS